VIKIDRINVLIVEDHALTRFGLKTALEAHDSFGEVYEAENGERCIEAVIEFKPDLVIMDLGLPGINGIEATRQIKSFDEKIKVLVLTSHKNEDEVWDALSAGANAYCMKDIEPDKLIHVIEFVNEGAAWLDPAVANIVLKTITKNKTSKLSQEFDENKEKVQLTDRELDVLRLIVDGYSNQEISEKLIVSIHTAKAHVCNILQKLSVDDRTQAAIKALKDGIV
jgi:DNA-binding NarL/FixJ family response regulator